MGKALDTAKPVVEYLPGWHCDITGARRWEDLPAAAQDYILYLEKAVGCKITYIGRRAGSLRPQRLRGWAAFPAKCAGRRPGRF